ncbi:MAG: HAMP domain-containing sensor histidine kinase [Terricaulis sp.]
MIWRVPILAIVAAAVLVVIACAGSLWMVDTTGQALINRLERESATTELDMYAEMRREEGAPALVREVTRHARVAGEHHVVAIADNDGRLLAGNLTAWPQVPHGDTLWAPLPTEEGPDTIHAAIRTLPDGMHLLVGRDDSLRTAFAQAVQRVAQLAILVVALACLLPSGVLIALSVRSVRDLASTAQRISDGQFSARTPMHRGSGPFKRIAEAQNDMLDRIEHLVTGLKTVTDSLAHDLRTPLARLRSTLERGIVDQGEPAKQDALEDALTETNRTIFAFSSLIDIARAEGGISREAMTRVDLAALLHDVTELFQPLAEERRIELRVNAPPAEILGHKPLLMQAVGNLVHNAIKHSPEGARLDLALVPEGSDVRIVVADHGPGIPADQRADAVKRFQRLGSGDTPEGVGLGLAIVEACAHLHRGSLELEDNNPGLKAALILRA